MELMFSLVPEHLPMYFYELMEIDISRKSREDYMSEIYDEEEEFPPMMHDDDYSDDEEDAETVFDDFLNVYDLEDFDELVPATPVDEGYVSDDGDDDDDEPVLYNPPNQARVEIQNPPNQARAEFQLDYIFPDDKRVPDWEYLYDDEEDEDDEDDSDEDDSPEEYLYEDDKDDSDDKDDDSPDWEYFYYLYDDSDDEDGSNSDDDSDFESATNSDADDEYETYDSDYECDYENERF